MISTTMHRFARSIKTPIITTIDRGLAHQTKLTCTIGIFDKRLFSGFPKPESVTTYQLRTFSTQITTTETLRALDMEAVREIKAELMEVDANSDDRYARNGTTTCILSSRFQK
jgi:hypothetical protein